MSTLELIKILREKTGAGLADCKKALAEGNNDIEQAVVCLRKKGLADMAKRAGRETKEGRVCVKTDGKHYAMAYLGCETDFVAQTPEFIGLVEKIVDYMLANPSEADYTKDETLAKIIQEAAPKFGENVSFAKAVCWPAPQGCAVINHYLHTDNKKAAMVQFEITAECEGKCGEKKAALLELAKNIAMQGVGMVAQYLNEADVPAEVIEKEKDIAITQAKNEGKPQAAIEKMIPGRIQKFFKDVVLLDQPSIKDGKLSVRQYIDKAAKELGVEIKVSKFVRF
jgi:elongation factor Ts